MNFHSIPRAPSGTVDALLASYAVGAVTRPMHALVASHLALKADNRPFVAALEGLAAEEMAAFPAAPVADRSRRLASIFSASVDSGEERVERSASILPDPLSAFLGSRYEDLPWRSVMPGLKEVRFEDEPGCEASMLWIRAGRAMPSHTHAGVEATLVLKGAFVDSAGRYERGDLAVVDSDIDHKPIADEDEDCICFAVSDGPVRLTGPIARLFQKLLRH